jgi:hypothetical protein
VISFDEMLKRWCSFLCFVAMLLFVTTANADNVAQAEALFNAARTLRDAGDYTAACPKFEASMKLDGQLGTLINIADCYEKLGKWATAWARYKAAQEWAERDNDDRLKFIGDGRTRVAPKVPKIIITVTNPAADLRVKREDTEISDAMVGVPLPIDPGRSTVSILRGGDVLETRDIEAKEGETTELSLDLAAIAAAHPAVVVEPQPAPQPQPQPQPDKPTGPYDPTHRNVGLVVGGVGVVAVLVAGGLEIGALIKKGQAESDDACVNKFCSAEGLSAADDAKTFAEVGQWVGIGGLATLAIGATIFFTAPSEPDGDSAALKPIPWVGPGIAGLSLGGSF